MRFQAPLAGIGESWESERMDVCSVIPQAMLTMVGPRGQTGWVVGCVDEAEVVCLRKGVEKFVVLSGGST